MTAETTFTLQDPARVSRVHIHRRSVALLEVHGPGNSERAVVRRTLVAIVDVKSIVNVDLTVDRNDQTESGIIAHRRLDLIDAHLRRAHVVSSFGSAVVTLVVRASARGIQFIVACCAPFGDANPPSLKFHANAQVGVEANSSAHHVATKTTFGLNTVRGVASGERVYRDDVALCQIKRAGHVQ